jgi:hypothetical protein
MEARSMIADHDSQNDQPRRAPATTGPQIPWLAIAPLGLIVLMAAIAWLANLEQDLPDIRKPRDETSAAAMPGHELMMPGESRIESIDPQLDGDWVSQEIGELDWLATDMQGSRMRVAFYGTDAYLLARMGPDASRAYVRVNEEPVEHLSQDELGSYVNLWSGDTSDQPVLLARNLAHGEHLVEVIADGDGELAVSGFRVEASTPFSWAFVLAYLGLGSGMFLLMRAMLYALIQRSTVAVSGRSSAVNDRVSRR